MRTLSILLVMLLAACASPAQLLDRDPQLSYSTTRPAADVAACISEAWSQRMSNVTHLPTPTGYRVIIQHPSAGADAIAEVTKLNSGCSVKYVERLPALMTGWSMDVVSSCRSTGQ